MSADKKRPGLGIKMTSYDELCGGDIGLDNSVEINIEELHDFPDHPFRVKDDEQMDELVKSISLRGIINAIIVRKDPAGGYQIISGHRRTHAARKLGMDKVPALIVDVDDDIAALMMVDSNIQRTYISPGDKARAIKRKYDSLIHRGELSDKWSNDEIGEIYGISGRHVQRYLRLNELIPELLSEVDSRRLQFMAAVELSFIDKHVQKWIYEEFINGAGINLEKAKKLRILSETEELSREDVEELLQTGNRIRDREIVITESRLYNYFPLDYTIDQMQEVIYKLLDDWKAGRKEEVE